jgi:hypothetical protein
MQEENLASSAGSLSDIRRILPKLIFTAAQEGTVWICPLANRTIATPV